MSASFCIRTATPDEAGVLLEIQKASAVAGFGRVFPPDKYPFPSDAVLSRWQTALDDPAEVVVLAELDGPAVGLAAMRAEWLDALYVVPSCWVQASARGSMTTRSRGYATSAANVHICGCSSRTRVRGASMRSAAGG
jgi:hypothetical protein